jgi:hypothetical protein
MNFIVAQHVVPGTNLEIIIRRWTLGASGTRYGVAAYDTTNPNTKLSWRQRGTEYVFDNEADARLHANKRYVAIREHAASK